MDSIDKVLKDTFTAEFTVVFPKEKMQFEYHGIAQVEGEEMLIFIEYEVENRQIDYVNQIGYFNRTKNDFYVQVIATGTDYTCFGCYCRTSFIDSIFTVNNTQYNAPLPI